MSVYCPKCSSNLAITGSNHVNFAECTKCHNRWSTSGKPIEKFAFSTCPKCGHQHLECGDHDLRMCKRCLYMWVVGEEEMGSYNTKDGQPATTGSAAVTPCSPYSLVVQTVNSTVSPSAPGGGGGGGGGELDYLEIEPVEVEEVEPEIIEPEEEIIEVEPEEPPVDPPDFILPEAEVILAQIAEAIFAPAAEIAGGSLPIWYSFDVADIFQWAYPAVLPYFEEVREAIKKLGGQVQQYKQMAEEGIATAKSMADQAKNIGTDAKAFAQQVKTEAQTQLNNATAQLSADIASVAASIPKIPSV